MAAEAIAAEVAAREAGVPGLRPGCGARVLPGRGGEVALVYVHGFSASPEELSPVPEGVAADWGGPLYQVRLTGHGQDGAALARARVSDWRRDVAEAIALGRRLAPRVVVMGNSTGATLAALAVAEGAEVAGLVLVAPNFALVDRKAERLMRMPFAGIWVPWIVGQERSFPVESELHGRVWTTRYPTRSVVPVGDTLRLAGRTDWGQVRVPTLFAFAAADEVVDARATERAMGRWGGPVACHAMTMGPGDDPRSHVVAGDALSPGQSAGLVRAIADWGREVGIVAC